MYMFDNSLEKRGKCKSTMRERISASICASFGGPLSIAVCQAERNADRQEAEVMSLQFVKIH